MNQIKGKVIALLLAASVLVESVAGMMLDTRNVQAAEPEYVGYYYAAKGQPKVFQLSQKGTVKVTKDAGNKYTVSGNKVTFICTKEGTIELGNGKKQVSFVLYIGGNPKDC